MNFFWKNDEVYYFSNAQIRDGLSGGLTPLTESEILKHKTEPQSEFHTHWDEVTSQWIDVRSSGEVLQDSRKNMPHLTKREFRTKLRDAQLFDSVEAYVKAGDGYLQDAWEYADYFARLDPFILKAIEVLDLDPVMVDTLWSS